jgi:hypothetical protein
VDDRLSLIALGQLAGLSLSDIGEMLGSGREIQIDRALLAARADQFSAI